MVTSLPPVARAMLAVVVASLAATCWWMAVEDIAPGRAFRSPIPYAMLFLGLVFGLPVFFALQAWLGRKLLRYLALATLAIAPAAIYAATYFLYPRSAFAAFLLVSTAWVGTAVFWAFAARIDFDQ